MARQIVLTASIYCKYFSANSVICDAVLPKVPKTTGIQYSFSDLSLARPFSQTSPDSLNILIILCTVDDNIYSTALHFEAEQFFSDIPPLFTAAVLGGLVILCQFLLLRDTAALKCSFYTHHVTGLLQIDLISCQFFLHLFYTTNHKLFLPLIAPIPTFLRRVAIMNSKTPKI